MNKSQLAYLSGITFVSIGLIPISISISSIELFNDAPIFFLAGGIWLLLIIIFYSAFWISFGLNCKLVTKKIMKGVNENYAGSKDPRWDDWNIDSDSTY